MNWKAVYKELETNYGWTYDYKILRSPTRNVGIFYGELFCKLSNGFWHKQGKLPPVKDFGIAMDRKTKLLTYFTKDGFAVIHVDIS